MFDFFGLKKTRHKLIELEFVLEKQRAELKTLEDLIDRLKQELEKEILKNRQSESKPSKKKHFTASSFFDSQSCHKPLLGNLHCLSNQISTLPTQPLTL